MLIALCIPTLAFAHSSDDGSGFIAGLTHPIFGVDHLLAMVSVGILSSLIGHRHIWLVPLAFVSSMAAGAIVGIFQVDLPHGEFWIAISVVVLGLSIAIGHKGIPLFLIYGFISLFGVFHGYAHGVEMPNSASPAFYSFGFIISTSLLHLLGVGIGVAANHQNFLRKGLLVTGGGISMMGVWFLSRAFGVI